MTREVRPIELVYGDVPPSLNATLYRHWTQQRRAKKQWQTVFEQLLLPWRGDMWTKVRVEARLYFKTARRRDAGNYAALLDKALGDALVNLSLLADDTPEHYLFGGVVLLVDPEHPRTEVSLWPRT